MNSKNAGSRLSAKLQKLSESVSIPSPDVLVRAMTQGLERVQLERESPTMTLYHYTSDVNGHPEKFTTDPDLVGKHKYTKGDIKDSGLPRTFFYVDPKDREERLFSPDSPMYSVDYPKDKIYDLHNDPEGRKDKANSIHELLQSIISDGYHGVYYETAFPTVNLFVPTEVKRVKLSRDGKAKTWNLMKDRIRAAQIAKSVYRGDGGGVNYAFVSPSTRENSTIEQAKKGLQSPEMQELLYVARKFPSVISAHRGIGYWKDGAEESTTIKTGDKASLPSLAARLGAMFKQKQVIYFSSDPTGPDLSHTLVVPGNDVDKIHRDLTDRGVEYKTVIPGRTNSQVHILDYQGSLAPSIKAYADETGSKIESVPGSIGAIGDDDRERAQEEFRKHFARPHDLPEEDQWKLREGTQGSGNLIHHAGPYIVKDLIGHGDPTTEVNAAQALHVLGMPNIQAHDFNGKVATKYLEGSRPVYQVDKRELKAHVDPQKMMKLAVAEWLMRAGDRHTGNYLFHPDHGIVPIDFGHTFHPATFIPPGKHDNLLTHLGDSDETEDFHGGDLARRDLRDVGSWGLSYYNLPTGNVDTKDLESFLSHQETIAQLAHGASKRFGDHEAELAAEAVRHRFQALRMVTDKMKGEPIKRALLNKVLHHYSGALTAQYMRQAHGKTLKFPPKDYVDERFPEIFA